jgi:hypothetical protein
MINPILSAVISFLLGVVDVVILIHICYLIIMHIWIRCIKGLTTYEYILQYVLKENIEKQQEFNDQSDHVTLKIKPKKNSYLNYSPNKKGRNKITTDILANKIKEEKKIEIIDNSDKIIIDDKDFNSKIFKPMIDEIYYKDYPNDNAKIELPNVITNVNNSYSFNGKGSF